MSTRGIDFGCPTDEEIQALVRRERDALHAQVLNWTKPRRTTMFKGFSSVLISKSGIAILLSFLTMVIANVQDKLGEMGDEITVGAGLLAAVGLALRHTLQKIWDKVSGKQ